MNGTASDAVRARRLSDLAEIRTLLARYCELVDRRDAFGVARAAFTTGAVDDHGIYGQAFVGRPAIEEMFLRSNGTTQCSAHHIGEPVILLDGDTARTSTPVTGWTWLWRGEEHRGKRIVDWVFTGTYRDLLVRTVAGWQIAERLVTPLGIGATGWGAPPNAYGLTHSSIGRAEGARPE